MTKKTIGVAGIGGVAINNYLPFLAKQQEYQLCLCSRDFSKAQQVAEKFQCTAVSTPAEMMAKDPEVIFILNREEFHLDLCRAFLPFAPKRLFVEKPLSARNGQSDVRETDFIEAKCFLSDAEKCGTEVAMNFNYRFFSQTERLRQIVAEKNFGELQQSSWVVNYACWSHMIDLLLAFSGGVSGITGCGSEKIFRSGIEPAYDIAGAFRTVNGGSGTILGTAGTAFQQPLYSAVLSFERGMVSFSDLDISLTVFENGCDDSVTYSLNGNKSRWDRYSASFENSIRAYLESISKGLPPPVRGMDGLRELQFEAALRRAAAQGRYIELDKEFPLN